MEEKTGSRTAAKATQFGIAQGTLSFQSGAFSQLFVQRRQRIGHLTAAPPHHRGLHVDQRVLAVPRARQIARS